MKESEGSAEEKEKIWKKEKKNERSLFSNICKKQYIGIK